MEENNKKYLIANKNNNLAQLRLRSCLSQSELALKANVSRRAIQSYEQGSRDINKMQLITAIKLSDVLGCSPKDLIS